METKHGLVIILWAIVISAYIHESPPLIEWKHPKVGMGITMLGVLACLLTLFVL